jgi:hypothetical protein
MKGVDRHRRSTRAGAGTKTSKGGGSRKAGGAGSTRTVERPFPQRKRRAKELDTDDRLRQRAIGVLCALRKRNVQPKRILGGRVQAGSVDPLQMLIDYYRVLGVLRSTVAAHPSAAKESAAFLDDVSIPDDLRSALFVAVALPPVDAEPEEELGTAELAERWMVDNAFAGVSPTSFGDDTIRDVVFQAWSKDLSKHMRECPKPRTDEDLLQRLRVFARAKAINVPGLTVSDWSEVTGRLPKTERGMRVLGRLMRAFKVDPKDVLIAGVHALRYRPPPADPVTIAGPVGTMRFPKNAGERPWNDVMIRLDPRAMQLDDETIQRVHVAENFGSSWGQGPTLQHMLNGTFPADVLLRAIHLCARMRELEIAVLMEPRWLQWALDRLEGQQAVDAARRLCRVFEIDERAIRVEGRMLSEQPPTRGLPSALKLDPPPPFGARMMAPDLARDLLAQNDAALFEIEDESLAAFVAQETPAILQSRVPSRDALANILRLLDRGLHLVTQRRPELGAYGGPLNPLEMNVAVGAFLEGNGLFGDHARDPEMAELTARFCHRAGVHPSWFTSGKDALNRRPELLRAMGEVRNRTLLERAGIVPRSRAIALRSIPDPAPLGKASLAEGEGAKLAMWKAKDTRIFRLKDEDVRQFGKEIFRSLNHWDHQLDKWLSHWKAPAEVFRFFARACELEPRNEEEKDRHEHMVDHARHYLRYGTQETPQGPRTMIPAKLVTRKSFPWILRMAKAAQVPLAELRYSDARGWHPLSEHPEAPPYFSARALEDAARDALEAGMQELSSSSAVALRGDVVARLLSGEDPAIELKPLVEAFARARGAGWAPLDVSELDDVARAAIVQKALAGWDHIGAAAVLAGLTMRVDARELQALFVERGHLPDAAREWAQVAEAIALLPAADLGAVLRDVLEGTVPDFSTLHLRVALAKRCAGPLADGAKMDPELAGLARRNPAAFARVALERASREAERSVLQSNLLELVDRALADQILNGEEVWRAAGPFLRDKAGRGSLLGALVVPLQEALDSYESPHAPSKEWRQSFARAFDRLARFVGPGRSAELAFPELYDRDLEFVIPLGEVEHRGDSIALAFRQVDQMSNAPLAETDEETKLDWQWIENAVQRALSKKNAAISEQSITGLIQAFRAGLISQMTLERARDTLSPEAAAVIAHQTAGARTRAILLNRPLPARRAGERAVWRPIVEAPLEGARVVRGPIAPRGSGSEDV